MERKGSMIMNQKSEIILPSSDLELHFCASLMLWLYCILNYSCCTFIVYHVILLTNFCMFDMLFTLLDDKFHEGRQVPCLNYLCLFPRAYLVLVFFNSNWIINSFNEKQ